MFSFKSSSGPVVGLDISSSAVKLLHLSRSSGVYKVEHYAVEPLPPNAVSENNLEQPEAIGEAISRALKRARCKAKQAVIAVPGAAVISKVVTMPADLSEADLEAQIELEAQQHVPYPREEVSLDFWILGPVENNPESMNVLVAASRTENVDGRVGAAELGGLSAQVVDVDSYASANAFALIADQAGTDDQQLIAVIDIGATNTDMIVVHKGRTIYSRDQAFGGRQLTEEIMRRYGISYEEAGEAKRRGGLPETYEEEVLEPFKEAMVQQVSRALQFFYSTSEYDSVDHVYLAGGCAAIDGIAELAQEQIGLPVTIANPLAGMTVANRIDESRLAEDAPALMIACGLALRSFDG